ncbi:MAG: outer membrane protein assembly factor BamA [Bryobacterales bacterium]|nr:outer membrane protein assembly factor BamA [Bryobacterales bacterium]
MAVWLWMPVAAAQAPAPQNKPAPFEPIPQAREAEQPKPQAPKPGAPSPFERVPEAVEQPKPEAPKAAQVEPLREAAPAGPPENIVEAIEFRGARRVPQDTLRAMIFTRKGDRYDEDALRRDFMQLWNTGRFDDIRLEVEPGKTGWIVRFVLVERQVVRTIKYEGVKSVTVSEILDRFKERRVGLSVESQYDPNKVQRAVTVLRDFLAERGRQFAEVKPELRRIPPSSVEIVFRVQEGPKVKVGRIDIQGNQVFGDRAVRRAMRNLRPVGIPYSILFENLFAKSYDLSKLEEDKERIRDWYQQRGYFLARALDHQVTIRDVGGGKFRVPLFYMNRPGKRADIVVPIEEGRQYRIAKFNLVGVKLFRAGSERLTRELFQMGPGDIFSTAKFRKGLENLRKLYGEFGYIDFVPEPDFQPYPNEGKLDVIIHADEGSQFFVRRIDFVGNTTTRDKVIRRELLIDEGDVFNTRLWELSILRLNQLGYFEQLKENEAADIKRDTRTNTVDITLKVKERGKNSVGMTGGVSGIAGSFVGFNYATNNFLGLGETLSIDTQLGDRLRAITFGFTEPYFLDRPIQLGFTVFTQRFNYDQGREVSLFTGRNLLPYFEALGKDNLLNYVSNGHGFTVFTSYPLRRTFARVSLTYSYSTSKYTVLTTAAKVYFDYINFQGLGGPNTLTGIRTSQITPSYIYNTVDHPITPTRGKSIALSCGFAGSFLGGNVNMIQPSVDFKWFRAGFRRGHVIGLHLLGAFVSGYGGRVAPPFNRWYIGGEQDVRGFEIWGISPVAYMPSEATIHVLNDDGSARMQKVVVDGVEQFVPVTRTIPIYQMIFPGGDAQGVGNFEYRIPIVGPVNLAIFFDAGLNKILRPSQLTLNPDRLAELNSKFPQAGFDGRVRIAEGTQRVRTSTGLELQVLLPVVNAPFRVYWAYNPTIVRRFLQPPVVVDRSHFPNQATFVNSLVYLGQPVPFWERRTTFRFTIGRTF